MALMNKRELQARKTRANILRAGSKLFTTVGFEATTIREIAKVASVSVGAVYAHFINKEGLLGAVVEDGLKRVRTRVLRLVDAALSGEQVPPTAYPQELVDFTLEDPGLARLICGPDAQSTEVGQIALKSLYQANEIWVRRMVKIGNLRNDLDPALLSTFWLSTVIGVMYWYAEDTTRINKDELVRSLADMWLPLLMGEKNPASPDKN